MRVTRCYSYRLVPFAECAHMPHHASHTATLVPFFVASEAWHDDDAWWHHWSSSHGRCMAPRWACDVQHVDCLWSIETFYHKSLTEQFSGWLAHIGIGISDDIWQISGATGCAFLYGLGWAHDAWSSNHALPPARRCAMLCALFQMEVFWNINGDSPKSIQIINLFGGLFPLTIH